MFRTLALAPILLVAVAACATSSSGDAPNPIRAPSLAISEAGGAALTTGPVNSETCEGALGTPPSTHTLELQSLTATAQNESQQIDAMCSAVYETENPIDPFLTVALIKFDSDEPSLERYDLLKNTFVAQDIPISELDNSDEDLADWFSALMDSDGIGRTTVLRQRNWVLTVSNGPTTEASPWTSDDLHVIGASILDRAQD